MGFWDKMSSIADASAQKAASAASQEIMKQFLAKSNATCVVEEADANKFVFTATLQDGTKVKGLMRDRYMSTGEGAIYLGGSAGGRLFG